MADKYDLLSDHPNATFAVVFDVYTPRPHFIIVPQKGVSVAPEFSRITSEQTQQLIETGMSVINCEDFEIDRGTLSIHRGSWKTNKKKFHANFCVEVEKYLRVFESRKEATLNWSTRSKDYVTNEWKYSKDPESYGENVRRYPYKRNLEKEVIAIGRNFSCPRDDKPEEVSLEGGITKVYHPSHPKIGFVRTKPKTIEEFQQVLTEIEKFAEKLRLSRDGCHICLYLGSVATDEWNFKSEDGKEVVGHIVMAGLRFYQLCPVDQRKKWFHAYKESKFQYELT